MSKPVLSVYGASGFVGARFCEMAQAFDIARIGRDDRAPHPRSRDILYLISTTDNYNVFDRPSLDVETNLLVLSQVLPHLDAGRHIFNFISSWFVYGETELPAHENSACRPKGFYSITKKAAEDLIVSYCETMGIDYRILRLCNVYGPGDRGVSKKKNALQYLINEMKANRPISLYHDGDFYRDYMHVDDVCRAVELCLREAPVGMAINVGSGERLRFRALIEKARELTDSTSEISAIEPPEFHSKVQVKDFYMDTSRLKALGFSPRYDIEEGLRSICREND
jgi:nucleoside-diphosphate-sugar epimerase